MNNRRERRPNQRTGNGKGSVVPNTLPVEVKARDTALPATLADGFPVGKRLRAAEFEASKQFSPKDANSGKRYCWNFNANCGCSHRGDECPFVVHQAMKHTGIHWAARAQLERRGGLKGTKVLAEKSADGFIQSLRETNMGKLKGGKKGQNPPATTGGYDPIVDHGVAECFDFRSPPPGLELGNPPIEPGLQDSSYTHEYDDMPNLSPIECEVLEKPLSVAMDHPNHWVGIYPGDVQKFDFTSMEGDYRLAIFGRGDWLIRTTPTPVDLEEIGQRAKESWCMEITYQGYLSLIDPALHCSLLNWMSQLDQSASALERNVALGLQNIMERGNSYFRPLASQALA